MKTQTDEQDELGGLSDGLEIEPEKLPSASGGAMTSAMPAEVLPQYVVLRGREELGPFFLDRLGAGLGEGEFTDHDLARRTDRRLWTPIKRLLVEEGRLVEEIESTEGAFGAIPESIVAPLLPEQRRPFFVLPQIEVPWRSWLRNHPGTIALGCIVFAAGTAFLVRWPLTVCAPWMIGGVIAGFNMILRQRPLVGMLACLAALLLPLVLLPPPPKASEPAPEPLPVVEIKPLVPPPTKTDPARKSAEPGRPSDVPGLGLPEPTPR